MSHRPCYHQCRKWGEKYGWSHDFFGVCLEGCGSDECIWYGEPDPALLPHDERLETKAALEKEDG